ncbi:ABC transporter permease [Anaeromyxobacter paludicola]|uniref:Transport permease protein n=1 Tax=Anaeromyxobacter paludicola TaxID=2918171 RepID=A0ABN6N1W4_9BACT|nr:ABC transporter permease [Anaeromyxobacter paludicola]BDG07189.1 transport permease protein [Anaeromyxobacter paludicola]
MNALSRPFVELYRFRELLALLVGRDLKVRYKRSVLGMFWSLLNPLLQMVVYTLVFSTIMKVGVPQFPVFLLSGLLPWTLISVSSIASAHALLNNQGLIRKVAVPQAVYPIAVVGSKLVDLLLSLVPLALLAALMGRVPGPSWLMLLPALAFATAFTAGLSLLFSSLMVFFRDTRHLIDILFQVWFYLTPVIYPASYLEKLPYPAVRRALELNPAAPIVRCFQSAIYDGRVPDPRTLLLAAGWAALSLGAGLAIFERVQDRHIHYF